MKAEEGMMAKYNVRIVRRNFEQSADDYHATVTRLSDGVEMIWTNKYRWMLKWHTRRKKLDRWFAKRDKRQEKLADVQEFSR